MTQWVPNESLYGPGGGDHINDLGESTPDPYGALRPLQFAGAPMGTPGAAQIGGVSPVASSNPAAEIATDRTTGSDSNGALGAVGGAVRAVLPGATPDTSNAGAGPPDPAQVKAGSPHDSGMQPAPLPPPEPPGLGGPKTESEHTSEDSSTGLSAKDRSTQEAGIGSARTARQAANAAQVQQASDAATLEQARGAEGLANAAQAIKDNADKIAVQEHVLNQVDEKLKAGADWRPDRTELFHGDPGAVFGISAAVAAMAGGWLMGQGLTGGKNPYLDAIVSMINENANDQVRKNSAIMQQLIDHKGDVKAAVAELKQRQLAQVGIMAQAQARKDNGDLMQKGTAALTTQLAAQDAQWENDQRKALMQSITHKTADHLKRITDPNATTAKLPRQLAMRHANNAQFVQEWAGIKPQLHALEQDGSMASYLGTVATKGANWVQENLNGLPPKQQQAAILIARLEELNHLHTGSSMVGLSEHEKERFGKVGVPTKARELSNTYTYFDTLAREKIEQNRTMASGHAGEEEPTDDEPVGGG